VGGPATGAVTALRTGSVDALSNIDPGVSRLQRSGDLRVVADTRIGSVSDSLFGGPLPSGCLYARQAFIERHPRTVQALTNAIVRACRWIRRAGPSDVVRAVPEAYLMGDAAVYLDAFLANRDALSPDGHLPESGAATTLRALRDVTPSLRQVDGDLQALYTNEFTRRANAQFAQDPGPALQVSR
jgi:NitT/TauT family transport system substrate-binding protein